MLNQDTCLTVINHRYICHFALLNVPVINTHHITLPEHKHSTKTSLNIYNYNIETKFKNPQFLIVVIQHNFSFIYFIKIPQHKEKQLDSLDRSPPAHKAITIHRTDLLTQGIQL